MSQQSEQVDVQNIRALNQILGNLGSLAGVSMGSQIKGVVTSPEFAETMRTVGKTVFASTEFKESIREVGSGIITDMLQVETVQNIIVSLIEKGLEKIFNNSQLSAKLAQIITDLITGIAKVMQEQSERTTQAATDFIKTEFKAIQKETLEGNLTTIQELIVQGIQGALCNLRPTLDIKCDMSLSE